MALDIERASGFDAQQSPRWKTLVADIANPLFDRDDITEREIGDWLQARIEAEAKRDRIKAEHAWWWGYE